MNSNPYSLSKSVTEAADNDSIHYEEKGFIKGALKKLRSSQPFNFVATSTLRSLSNATGLHSEFVIKHMHKVGKVSCKLPNGQYLRLWFRGDDWVSNQLYWRGLSGYEPETVPLFFRLASRADVTLDVGAYVGFYTLLAAHANPNGAVYAFEPLPKIHERLQKNIGLNRMSNVECLRAAVGQAEGKAEFFHVDAGLPTSSSLSFEFMRTTGELRSTTVPVITLDRFIKDKGLRRVRSGKDRYREHRAGCAVRDDRSDQERSSLDSVRGLERSRKRTVVGRDTRPSWLSLLSFDS